MLTFYIVAIL